MARHSPTVYVRFDGRYQGISELWARYFRDFVTGDTEEYSVWRGNQCIRISFLDERLRLVPKRLSMYTHILREVDGVSHDAGILVLTCNL